MSEKIEERVKDESYEWEFINRKEELSKLKTLLNKAETERNQIALISGKKGVGKSRILEEFAKAVKLQNKKQVKIIQCDGENPEIPYSYFDKFVGKFKKRGKVIEGAKEIGGISVTILGVLFGLISDFFSIGVASPFLKIIYIGVVAGGVITYTAEKVRKKKEIEKIQRENDKKQAVKIIQKKCKNGLLVLVVNNLHNVDDSSFEFLFNDLFRKIKRILILGEYLPGSLPPLKKNIINELTAKYPVTEIFAPHFSDERIQKMIEDYYKIRFPEQFYFELFHSKKLTQGNLTDIKRIFRNLKEEKMIYRQNGEWNYNNKRDFQLEEIWKALPSLKSKKLGESCRDILEYASLYGTSFKFRPFSYFLKEIESGLENIRSHLNTLVDAGLFLRDKTEDRYSFASAFYKEEIYKSLDESKRKELHRKIAEHLAKNLQSLTKQDSTLNEFDIAYHYLQSRPSEEGALYIIKAGKRLKEKQNYREALYYFQKAQDLFEGLKLNSKEHKKTIVNLLIDIGEVQELLDKDQQAMVNFEKALKLSREMEMHEEKAVILYNIGWIYYRRKDLGNAEKSYTESINIAKEKKLDKFLPIVYNKLAILLLGRKQLELAEKYFRLSLKKTEDTSLKTTVLDNLSILYRSKGDFKAAFKCQQRSLELALLHKDYRNLMKTHWNRATALVGKRKKEEAITEYEESRKYARRIEDLSTEAECLDQMGRLYRVMGEIDKAIACHKESLKFYRNEEKSKLSRRYLWLGLAYDAKDLSNEAKIVFEKALEIDPANTEARLALS